MDYPCPIPRRLRAAREAAGLSQKELGIAIGVDQFSASPRINHYEQGRHQPDYATVSRMAAVLKIPTPYFYAEDDGLAEHIQRYIPG